MATLIVPDIEMPPHYSLAMALRRTGHRIVTTGATELSNGSFGPLHRHYRLPGEALAGTMSQAARAERSSAALAEIVEREGAGFGLCGTDRHLRMMLAAAAGMAGFRVCAPSITTIDVLGSKVRARRHFQAHGLPVPGGRSYDVREDIEIDGDGLDYPVVFKRDKSEGSSGVALVKNKPELAQQIQKALLLDQDFIIEDFLGETREISHQFFIADGSWHPVYSLEKLAHFRTSYSTSVRQLSLEEERQRFAPMAQALAGALSDGFYSAQFKETVAGELRLIEISARPGSNFRIVTRILPELGPCIVAFYAGDPDWSDLLSRMRARPARHGVSVVEDALARLQRARIARAQRLPRPYLTEIAAALRLVGNRPIVDDYWVGLWRTPRLSIAYYRNFLQAWRQHADSHRAVLGMVSR